MITLDQALDAAMQLSLTEREMLVDILYRRQIEMRREEIASDAKKAIKAFHAGKLKPASASDLLEHLHASLARQED
jgi:hypothetical protein